MSIFHASSSRAGWLTLLSVGAVVAVNVAGLWSIAVARRSVVEEAGRLFRLDTETRARALEGAIARSRVDVVFLAGSSAISRLGGSAPAGPRDAEWRRLGAEAALLIFLRGHPEIVHISVLVGKANPIVEAGWRGGVPMVWLPPSGTRAVVEMPSAETKAHVFGVFALDTHAATASALRLVAELDPKAMLTPVLAGAPESRQCRLADATGRWLTHDTREMADSARASSALSAETSVHASGWSSSSPWRLTCAESRAATVTLLEPLSQRYRLTVGLNLGVMGLTLLLGWLTVHQLRRRERLEGQAREETRVRELERQLFHSERLATVGRVVAGIAHEINNPVNAVINSLGPLDEIIKKIAADESSPATALANEAVEILAVVQRGAARTKAIVQALHGYARGDDSVQREVLLSRGVDETLGLLQHRMRQVKVVKDVEPNVRIMGFPGQIDQVLMNLLTNAAQAMGDKGGTIKVAASNQDHCVLLTVADDGPGIPKDVLPRIFDPFFTTKDVGEGSGLGLSIVHGIVERHGGHIDVESEPGQGTKFSISFPLPPAVRPS